MSRTSTNPWPDLAIFDLRPTTDALHLWSQVVGKVRLMLTPWINHSCRQPFTCRAAASPPDRSIRTGALLKWSSIY